MFERIFNAAQGYLQLGMPDDTLAELSQLPEKDTHRPEVLQLRIWALMRKKRWDAALEYAHDLCAMAPDLPVPFLDAAYCLHELKRTGEARDYLQNGPKTLREYPTFHYNLACYEATLGHAESARAHLEIAIRMEPRYKEEALSDPDLSQLYRNTFPSQGQ